MKLTIRKGMFETNSSSMHSAVISLEPYVPLSKEEIEKRNKLKDDYHIGYGCKEIEANHIAFHRGEAKILLSSIEKAQVLILVKSMDLMYTKKYQRSEYEKEMKEYCDKIKKIISSQLGYSVEIDFPSLESYHYKGKEYLSINVEEEGILDDLNQLLIYTEKEEDLIRFLCDGKSFIILGGDEYSSVSKVQYLVSLLSYKKVVIGNFYPDDDSPSWYYSTDNYLRDTKN